jgi:Icc-related predicted phosphoesterase
MIIDCIADLHGHYPKLEGGDLLIVAGDLTARDVPYQYMEFALWLDKQKYKRKILIAGNHDNNLHRMNNLFEAVTNLTYLCDSSTEAQGLKIWGSPWTKTFLGMNPHCKAFTVETEEELAEKWALIPNDIDILVTHSPPFTIKDGKNPDQNLGSTSLMKRISNVNLKLHVFGHIHEGYGLQDMRWLKLKNGFNGAVYINCSHVNERYQPVNKPVRIEL